MDQVKSRCYSVNGLFLSSFLRGNLCFAVPEPPQAVPLLCHGCSEGLGWALFPLPSSWGCERSVSV